MAFRSLDENEGHDGVLVIDNSVMMRWLFKDGSLSDQRYSKKVLTAINDNALTVIVPYLWVYESAFVTHYYVKQKSISYEDAMSRVGALFELSTVIRGKETPAQLLHAARSKGVSSYDASYLLLAGELDCPLATLDKKMRKAFKKSGGSLFE